MVNNTWFLALLAFAAVAMITVTFAMILESAAAAKRRRDVMRRLQSGDAFDPAADGDADTAALFRQRGGRGRDPGPLAELPHLRDVAIMLEQAGLGWTVQSYLVAVLGLALAGGVLGLLVTRSFLVALGLALAGAIMPYIYVRRKKRRRVDTFEEQFPEAIDLLGRAIRAGHPLSAGMRMVAEEAPDPVAGEFRQVFEEQRFGLPFEEALLGIADRIDLVDVRILVTAILIQREVGGNLAEILDKIAHTIRARFAIRRQLRVYTAQGRLSGYVLAAMPIVVGFAIFLLDRSYVMMLFEEPIGRFMVVGAVVMQIIGYLWIRKVVNIEI